MSKVKELREKNNIKQCDMAALIRTSPANYLKKENGDIRFNLTEAQIISKYFNDTIENIFFDNEVSQMEIMRAASPGDAG